MSKKPIREFCVCFKLRWEYRTLNVDATGSASVDARDRATAMRLTKRLLLADFPQWQEEVLWLIDEPELHLSREEFSEEDIEHINAIFDAGIEQLIDDELTDDIESKLERLDDVDDTK